MRSKKGIFFFVFLSLLVFFIPLLLLLHIWFADGSVILGHDSGFTLNAAHELQKKSFTWWEDNFGTDGAYYISSQFIHMIDLLSTKLAGLEGGGNAFVIFFWFCMMFFSMLPLSFYIGEKINNRYITFLFPVFFIFNFFLFQSVFIFERTKYSLLVSLPIFLFFCFLIREKKIPTVIAAIGTSLTIFIFNGGGWGGIPLYGSIMLTGVTFFIFTLIEAILTKKLELIKRIAIFFFLSVFFLILLDAYSFFPAIYTQMFSGEKPLENMGTDQSWVETVSFGTSFINLFRMQGIPDWYSNHYEINLQHPYASLYTMNPILIFLSFLIPIIAFLSFLFAKNNNERRYVYFFALLMLIGMAFSAGSHPPLGTLFIFLYEHVPFFWIFRSPFYKFAPAYLLGVSFLISFSVLFMITKVTSRIQNESRQKYSYIGILIFVIVCWFSFHFAFFNKNIFSPWEKGFSTLVSIPSYVHDFGKWANGKNLDDSTRILLLPPLSNRWSADTYRWGYWSLAPLPQLLTNKSIITNDTGLKGNENQIISNLYKKIQEGNEKEVTNIAVSLGISYFLVRDDAVYGSSEGDFSPLFYKKQLEVMPNIRLEKSFGLWKIYQLTTSVKNKIYAINKLSLSDEISDYFDFEKDPSYQFAKKEDIKNVLPKISPFTTFDIQRLLCVSCKTKSIEVSGENMQKLQDKDWQIFHFSVSQAGTYDMFSDLFTLPRDSAGKTMYPEKMIFINKSTGNQKELNFLKKNAQISDNKNLFGLSRYFDLGEYNEIFVFPKLTNLLQAPKSVTPTVNGRNRYCFGGNISLFSSKREYAISFTRQQENQSGTFLFIEDDRQGENVLPDTTSGPQMFRYTYTPLSDSKAGALFICGFNFFPNISNVFLTDKLEPRTFLVINRNRSAESSLPQVTFKKINPTRYSIHIGAFKNPFILVFNERFNEFWELVDLPEINASHFQINGFANGWIFDKSDGYDVVLEYTPQQKVYQGEIISVITFIILIIYLSYWLWKQKKR